ncbi:MAG: hypothetical protein JOZ51_23820, partial [Chloroflexi bacterium]|nr:hypothetical protein [Chloroflexota bacterium]
MIASNQGTSIATGEELPRSARRDFKRAMRQPAVLAGIVILIGFGAAAILAPWLSPTDPLAQNVSAGLHPPSAEYLFGTDKLGR